MALMLIAQLALVWHLPAAGSHAFRQVRVDWLADDIQPQVNRRVIHAATRRVARHVQHFDALKAKERAQVLVAQRKVLNTLKKAVTPARIEQTVVAEFRTPSGAAAANLDVHLDLIGKDGTTVSSFSRATDSSGRVKLTVSKFPVVLKPAVVNAEWALADPANCLYALKGTEGSRVSSFGWGRAIAEGSRLGLDFQGLRTFAKGIDPVRVERAGREVIGAWGPTGRSPATYLNVAGFSSLAGASYSEARITGDDSPMPRELARGAFDLGAPQSGKVLKRAYTLPEIRVERLVADVEVDTDPNASVQLGDETLGNADDAGRLKFKIPVAKVGAEGVPLSLHRSHDGATFDGAAELMSPNPYGANVIHAEHLPLSSIDTISVTKLDLAGNDLPRAEAIQKLFGRPKLDPRPREDSDRRDDSPESLRGDGSVWWHYQKQGVDFKVRSIRDGSNKQAAVVEGIRLTSDKGGQVAGLGVGASVADVQAKLGPGQPSADSGLEYLDGGLVFETEGGQVKWIDLRRPVSLITRGADSSTPSRATRIYVEAVQEGREFAKFPEAKAITEHWLAGATGIAVTTDRSQADFVVGVALDNFAEKRENLVGVVPMKVDSSVGIRLNLIDATTGRAPVGLDDKPVEGGLIEGKATADYRKEVQNGALVMGAIAAGSTLIKDPLKKAAIQIALGVSASEAVENMKKTMARATERCREFALRNAVEQVYRRLTDAAELRLNVIAVSAREGTLTVAGGRKIGLALGAEFELYNGAISAFEASDDPLKEHLVVARVIEVGDTSSVCQLFLVERSVDRKMNEQVKETRLYRPLLQLLDPHTLMVHARRVLRLQESATSARTAIPNSRIAYNGGTK